MARVCVCDIIPILVFRMSNALTDANEAFSKCNIRLFITYICTLNIISFNQKKNAYKNAVHLKSNNIVKTYLTSVE